RRALNKFEYALPSTLPDFGSSDDGPGVLINEIHSFGQIFSGCFYDTVVNVHKAAGNDTEAGLLKASQTAGQILIQAARQAPQKTRYFREVGRAMMLSDQQKGGANQDAIRDAFQGHGISVSLGALAPETVLAGAAPKLGAKPALTGTAKKDLL